MITFVVTTMITIPMIYMIYTVITITIPIIIISMLTIVSIMAINLTRSVERALNQRRRALKLLQKETKRHSGAKVLLQIYIFLFHSEAEVSTKPISDNETLFTRHINILKDDDADKLNTAKADFDKKSQTLRLEKS